MILATAMRNAARYLDTWTDQIEALNKAVDLKVVVVEGDSDDESYKELLAIRDSESFDLLVLKAEHGGKYYPSLDIAFRWRQLAAVCNVVLTAAVNRLSEGEPLVYVESDLQWDVPTMMRLHHHVVDTQFPAVAPLSMQGARFYDVWGYSKNERRFSPWPPFHPHISADKMSVIDTCGSCVAMSYPAAQVAEFSSVDCMKGIGRSLAKHGYSLWLDPTLAVTHP